MEYEQIIDVIEDIAKELDKNLIAYDLNGDTITIMTSGKTLIRDDEQFVEYTLDKFTITQEGNFYFINKPICIVGDNYSVEEFVKDLLEKKKYETLYS